MSGKALLYDGNCFTLANLGDRRIEYKLSTLFPPPFNFRPED